MPGHSTSALWRSANKSWDRSIQRPPIPFIFYHACMKARAGQFRPKHSANALWPSVNKHWGQSIPTRWRHEHSTLACRGRRSKRPKLFELKLHLLDQPCIVFDESERLRMLQPQRFLPDSYGLLVESTRFLIPALSLIDPGLNSLRLCQTGMFRPQLLLQGALRLQTKRLG